MSGTTEMRPLAADDPLMLAWTAYKATEDFANAKRWAAHAEHLDGSLWACFMAGWQASQSPSTGSDELVERVARAIEGPHLPVPEGSKFTLDHLRDVRWQRLHEQERAVRRNEARSALNAIPSPYRVEAQVPAEDMERAITFIKSKLGSEVNAVQGHRLIPVEHLNTLLTALQSPSPRSAGVELPGAVEGLIIASLDWRVPDEDELGHENAVLTALGIGGSYDIGEQSDGYILWWAADPFTFQEGFASIEDAKAAAEQDWQTSIRAALNPKESGHG